MHEMSGVDASFLYFETPSSHMHVLATLVLDTSDRPGWGVADVRRLLRQRLDLLPSLRRKVLAATLRLHHPIWVDVPDLDVAGHITRVVQPGGMAELAQVVAAFAAHQLDRTRPLWEVLVVEGLDDHRVAVIVKVHHCATDGVGAARIMEAIFDFTPEGPGAAELEAKHARLAAEALPEPGVLDVARHTVTAVATRPLKAAAFLQTALRSGVRLAGLHAGSTDTSGGALPFRAPRASFNGHITPGRAVAYVDLQLDDVKRIKKGVDGTFNDAVIAICGGALRRYLSQRGELPQSSLISAVPVSVRKDGDTSANAVSAMFTSLATDIEDPLERLQAVRQANLVGKGTQAAVGDSLLNQVSEVVPPTVSALLARAYSGLRLADRHPVVHNVVISNVPGPPVDLYLGGARIVGLYPLGPVLEGPGLNITLVSVKDRVDVGLIACSDRMPDLADLAAAFPYAVDELLAALATP